MRMMHLNNTSNNIGNMEQIRLTFRNSVPVIIIIIIIIIIY